MKILHILDHSIPLHSGYTFRTRAILEQQRALGWETAHVTSAKHKGTGETTEQVGPFKFYRTTALNSFMQRLPLLNQWQIVTSLDRRLDEVIEQESPDILHAHSPALNGLAALRAGKRHGIPVVYECRAFWEDAAVDHGTTREGSLRYRLTRALETYVFNNADAVTTICGGLKDDMVARGIEENKITVIPNAVDVEKFSTRDDSPVADRVREQLDGKRVLGFFGSFYAYEGLPLLLDALPAVIEQQPDTRLLLVGGGPQEAAIRNHIDRLGLDDKVLFLGRVPHQEIQSYYNLVDIFVYPRLPMRLTELVTPLKPLEAMAMEKLVVASDVGGHRELIEDRVNGYLFPAGDVQKLAATLLELISTRHTWPKLKQAGRHYVATQRNWERSVSFYTDVYGALVEKGDVKVFN